MAIITGTPNNDLLVGTAQADTITGLAGNDVLTGENGNDSLVGDEGDDTLLGGAGHDTLSGGDNNDTLNGGSGNDSLEGGAGADSLAGDIGTDTLRGGAGSDYLDGGNDADVLYGDADNDTLLGGAAHDYLDGGDNEDSLDGGTGNDTLFGGAGVDQLTGGDGADNLNGDAGNDILSGGSGNDTLSGGDSEDSLVGDIGNDVLFGNNGGDTIYGGGNNDSVDGGADTDYIYGEAGLDTLAGGDGNDIIDGGADADIITGGTGLDTIVGGLGNDNIDGGDDSDTISGDAGSDTLAGGSGDDSVNGGDNNDIITGGSGFDILIGGSGNDNLDGGSEGDNLDGGLGADTLFGGDGEDSILGGDQADSLNGGTGNDVLRGGTSNDNLDGGDNNDSLYGDANNDTLRGSAGSDYLNGGEGVDSLDGGADGDTLVGGNGNDILNGGTGNDDLLGNGGSDTVQFTGNWGDDTVNAGEVVVINGTTIDGSQSAYTYTETSGGLLIEDTLGNSVLLHDWAADGDYGVVLPVAGGVNLVGTPGNDTLTGTAYDDTIDGLAGDDSISGLGGHDSLVGGSGVDTLIGGNGNDTLESGDASAPTLQAESLDGGDGDDVLIGGVSLTDLHGGAGNDTLIGDINDPVYANSYWRADYRDATAAISVSLSGSASSVVTGDASVGTDSLIDVPFVWGTGFADTFVADSSFSTIGNGTFSEFDGGDGDDTIEGSGNTRVSYLSATDSVTVILTSPGEGTAFSSNGGNSASIGTDTFLGGVNAVRGSNFNDSIVGADFAGENFRGQAGNDTIDGGAGGGDRADYFNATTGVHVDLVAGTAQDGAGGTDTLIEIEWVRASHYADTLIGNDANNRLIGEFGDDSMEGGLGSDTLLGGAGNDTLYAGGFDPQQPGVQPERLEGGDGDDSLISGVGGVTFLGGAGNDTLIGDTDTNLRYANQADYTASTGSIAVTLTGASGTGLSQVVGDASVGTDTLYQIERIMGSNYNDTYVIDASFTAKSGSFNDIWGNGGDDTITGNGATRLSYNLASDGVTVVFTAAGEGTAYSTNPGDTANVGVDTFTGVNGIRGSNFSDSFTGSDAAAETFRGRAGDDTLDGGTGSGDEADFYTSSSAVLVDLANGFADGEGSDVLIDIENVRGSRFDDTILGDSEDNLLEGHEGGDSIEGGDGIDTFRFRQQYDNDTVSGGEAIVIDEVTLDGSESHLTYTYTPGTGLLIEDGNGQSVLLTDWTGDGDYGISLGYGSIDDIIVGTSDPDTLDGGVGNDSISGLEGDDLLIGGEGHDTIYGDDGIDTIYGNEGNDILFGGTTVPYFTSSDYELIDGGAGHDYIDAGEGLTHVVGGAGNDILQGALFLNNYTNNTTRADYSAATAAINVTMAGGLGSGDSQVTGDASVGTDTLLYIEQVIGSDFADYYFADVSYNTLSGAFNEFYGNGGDDTIEGNGQTRVGYTYASDAVTIIFTGAGEGTAYSTNAGDTADVGVDTFTGVNSARGSNYADSIVGADFAFERLRGMDGDDTLDGGIGGNDMVDYANAETGAYIDLENGYALDGMGSTDTIINFEQARGGIFDDTILGDDNNNRLEGREGNDIIYGRGGFDTLDGGDGDDTLYGEDTVEFQATSTESLVGGAGNDVLDAGTGTVNMVGGTGDDTLVGGTRGNSGLDTNRADYRSSSESIAVTLTGGLGSGTSSVVGGASTGTDTLVDVERVFGTSSDDTFYADASFVGAFGANNEFQGMDGDDTLTGNGATRAEYSSASDGITAIFTSAGVGTAYSSNGGDTANVGTDTFLSGVNAVRGSNFDDSLVGSDDGDEIFRGQDGDDTLDGGVGGHDRADYNNSLNPVTVDLSNNTAEDGFSGIDTLFNMEDIRGSFFHGDTLIGDSVDNRIEGMGGNDSIVGGNGRDTLEGGDGDDTIEAGGDAGSGGPNSNREQLRGGAGNDLLISSNGRYNFVGGEGDDTFQGGNFSDQLRDSNRADYRDATAAISVNMAGGINSADSTVVGDSSVGTDTLINIDFVLGSNFADTYVSNPGHVTPVGTFHEFDGEGGDDTISGNGNTLIGFRNATSGVTVTFTGAQSGTAFSTVGSEVGTDTFTGIVGVHGSDHGDLLTGTTSSGEFFRAEAGNDTIDGGSGGGDIVDYLTSSNGINANLSTGTVQDGFGDTDTISNIEGVRGSAHEDTITGNGGNNTLFARGGNDTIVGNGGADTLDGGGGDDSLTGSAGADSFRFQSEHDNDAVADFVIGTDFLVFDNVTGVSSASDVLSAISYGPSDATITLADGIITLEGITSGITSSDIVVL